MRHPFLVIVSMMKQVVIICHNLRSTHNVGSILRSSDGFGITKVYFTGYTPYPFIANDTGRLPHIAQKLDKQISKTALGAEKTVPWQQSDLLKPVLTALRADGFTISALEQTSSSLTLPSYISPDKLAIIVGREVEGVEKEVLDECDIVLEIPMHGSKESFNVSVAAAVAMYQVTAF